MVHPLWKIFICSGKYFFVCGFLFEKYSCKCSCWQKLICNFYFIHVASESRILSPRFSNNFFHHFPQVIFSFCRKLDVNIKFMFFLCKCVCMCHESNSIQSSARQCDKHSKNCFLTTVFLMSKVVFLTCRLTHCRQAFFFQNIHKNVCFFLTKYYRVKINRKFHVATEIRSTFFGCWAVTGQLKKKNMIFYHQFEIFNR
jgi:hypothetical protein